MEQLSASATSRQNADKNLLTILLAGLGGSIVFHAAAIAGVGHLWQPTAAIDEPMEITMVDVDKPVPASVIPSPAPIVKPAQALAVKPEPKIITPQPKPAVPIVKAPAKVNLQPKPAPKVDIPALDKPIPIVKTKASLTANPAAKPNRPIVKTASKPVVAPKKWTAPTKPVVAAAFPDKLFRSTPQPAPTNKAPRPQQTATQPKTANNDRVASSSSDNQSGLVGTPSGGGGGLAGKLSNNPNPGGSGGNAGNDGDFGEVTPSKIGATGGGDSIGTASNQSGLGGNSSGGGRLTRGFSSGSGGGGDILTSTGGDGEFGKIAPSKIGANGGGDGGDGSGSVSNQSGLAGNSSGGGRLTRGFGGGSGGGNGGGNGTGSGSGNGSGNGIGGGGGDGDFGTVAQGNTWRGARNNPGNELGNPGSSSSGDDGGGGGTFGLQCINRCEISGLTDLEDRDGGKDKLRIKIAIDPKGNVTRASIAKSSGNSTIDRVVIDGVKQMQFSPPGKVVERVVKANILL